jgi:DNA-binding SARP family transcriptional activator
VPAITERTQTLRYRVLGSLELEDHSCPLELRGAKQRALLGIFLLHPNEVLTPDRLMEDLWGGAQPSAGRTALAMQVCRLRRLLHARGEEVLRTFPNGYMLNVELDRIDLYCFKRQLSEGGRLLKAGAFGAAAQTLGRALELWRGRPFEGLAYESFAQAEIKRLEEERLLALEERIEAELALGEGAELVAELDALVLQYPLREQFRSQLMLALYRSGRQADSLEVYRDGCRILREELGLEPSPVLQNREQAILRQDAHLVDGARSHRNEGTTALALRSPIRSGRHISWSCRRAVGD